MTPEEIASRIPPNERTRIVAALVAIELAEGVATPARRHLEYAEFASLRNSVIARALAGMERQQQQAASARAAVERAMSAPSSVIVSTRRDGKNEVRTIRGVDAESVRARAQALLSNIDAFRSPSLNDLGKDSHGRHVVEVRCHGLD